MWLFYNWSKTALQCCIGNCHYFWEKKKLIFLEAKREAVLPGILSLPAMMLTMNRLVSVCVKVQDESSYSFTQQMFDNRVYFLGCSKRRARKLSWRAGLALGTILEKELATGYTRERERRAQRGLKVRISGLDGKSLASCYSKYGSRISLIRITRDLLLKRPYLQPHP